MNATSATLHKRPIAFSIILLFLLLTACAGEEQPPPLPDFAPLPTAASVGTDASPPSQESAEQPEPSPLELPKIEVVVPVVIADEQAEMPTSGPVETTKESARAMTIADEVPSGVRALIEANGLAGSGVALRMHQGRPIGQWVYVAAVPFYSLAESVSLTQLQGRWRGEEAGAIVVSAETAALFTTIWGEPTAALEQLPADQISDRLWRQDGAIGIVPFQQLTSKLKPLTVDGFNPLDRDATVPAYGLNVPIGVNGDIASVADFVTRLEAPLSNRDPERMTTVALTGVTALVRATAYAMEQNGLLWAGEEVREVLNSADIAHISNEVAFVEDCPYPDPVGGTSFCSDVRYFELLQDLGTDVMELTGNHVNDYGAVHLDTSIDLYERAGMKYFGGGRNAEDATAPAVFEHNGNRILFFGCNSFGPYGAYAGAASAGSRPCDGSVEGQLEAVSAETGVVIMTLQSAEYYEYTVPYQQQAEFRRYANAGADIVSGSQGHHLQAFDLYGDSFIHYGPGNLFFDQMFTDGTRQSFINEYVIYDNRLIGVKLHTYLIEEFARPRLMTEDERNQILDKLFGLSLRE